MESKFTKTTDKLKKEKKLKKKFKLAVILLLLLLLILYFVIGIVYNNGNFSITLDKNLYLDNGIIIYDDFQYKVYRTELLAKAPETFNSIKEIWLPEEIKDYEGGSHNGDSYLVYTFYIENTGDEIASYTREVIIDDVIKNVDAAIRVRIYKNEEYLTYAKLSSEGEVEPNTVPFIDDKIIMSEDVSNFKPNDIDKYTIVLWIEGEDPDCTDNILGGEFKVRMNFKPIDAE